ncbi:serine/arginine repetitive matrix protein 1-like isoform X2 [Thrips palmi]|uniref:Serine/arginine repetitive matrix protein 1-like isoform X2 n=1 Tax=Thrips palmi TaxID=161013 RepID=A0A6P8ZMS9_THRPL|nr:serine/arginine repetitive matrix protein 1-like isoform X2 [Thrips palmi]
MGAGKRSSPGFSITTANCSNGCGCEEVLEASRTSSRTPSRTCREARPPHKQSRGAASPWMYAGVAATAAGCYVNALWGDFVHDDVPAVTTNKDVLGLTPLRGLLANDFWGTSMALPSSHKSYRPLTTLTFRTDHLVWGLRPVGFHLGNVALHLLACLLVARLAVSVAKLQPPFAALAALLFAAHPVHTEAVAGVVGRADVLAGVFFLLSFLAYHDEWRAPRVGASVLLAVLALLSKETGIMALPVGLLFDLYRTWSAVRRSVRDQAWTEESWRFAQRALKVTLSVALLLLCRWCVLQGSMPRFARQDNPAAFHPDPLAADAELRGGAARLAARLPRLPVPRLAVRVRAARHHTAGRRPQRRHGLRARRPGPRAVPLLRRLRVPAQPLPRPGHRGAHPGLPTRQQPTRHRGLRAGRAGALHAQCGRGAAGGRGGPAAGPLAPGAAAADHPTALGYAVPTRRPGREDRGSKPGLEHQGKPHSVGAAGGAQQRQAALQPRQLAQGLAAGRTRRAALQEGSQAVAGLRVRRQQPGHAAARPGRGRGALPGGHPRAPRARQRALQPGPRLQALEPDGRGGADAGVVPAAGPLVRPRVAAAGLPAASPGRRSVPCAGAPQPLRPRRAVRALAAAAQPCHRGFAPPAPVPARAPREPLGGPRAQGCLPGAAASDAGRGTDGQGPPAGPQVACALPAPRATLGVVAAHGPLLAGGAPPGPLRHPQRGPHRGPHRPHAQRRRPQRRPHLQVRHEPVMTAVWETHRHCRTRLCKTDPLAAFLAERHPKKLPSRLFQPRGPRK